MDFAGVYGVSSQRFGDKAWTPGFNTSEKTERTPQVQFDDMDPESEINRNMIDDVLGPQDGSKPKGCESFKGN